MDGETERVNQELKQYLRAYCNANQTEWLRLLPMAEYAHNTRIHSTMKTSLFKLVHGYEPPLYPEWEKRTIPKDRTNLIQEGWKEAHTALEIATKEMKWYHD